MSYIASETGILCVEIRTQASELVFWADYLKGVELEIQGNNTLDHLTQSLGQTKKALSKIRMAALNVSID